jgi:hypothetical protein
MSIERRRSAAAKAFERARRLGLEIDPDPAFAALIQSWINGELTMPKAREQYLAFLKDRTQRQRGWLSEPSLPEVSENEARPAIETSETTSVDESLQPRIETSQPAVPKRRRRRTRPKP